VAEAVQGIGGVFFPANNPDASDGDQKVRAPFAADTSYFGRTEQQLMVNFRVRDLDAMLGQLRAAWVDVDPRVEEHEYGRCGWATDPEGNRLEVWQPA
jgi:glyoxylase I family protein